MSTKPPVRGVHGGIDAFAATEGNLGGVVVGYTFTAGSAIMLGYEGRIKALLREVAAGGLQLMESRERAAQILSDIQQAELAWARSLKQEKKS